jgi:hypothetical protein
MSLIMVKYAHEREWILYQFNPMSRAPLLKSNKPTQKPKPDYATLVSKMTKDERT